MIAVPFVKASACGNDGTCDGVDLSEGTARIGALIEDVGPRSIFTFGPDGSGIVIRRTP